LVERKCLYGKAFVLMYHRVLPSPNHQPFHIQAGMYVTTASFEKQVSFLKKRFRVVFIEDLVKKIQRRENIDGLCAITFDDGWLDNYIEAFPVLKKHQVPSTVFLSTGFVSTDRIFWPEEICYFLDRHREENPAIEGAPLSLAIFCREISKFHPYDRGEFLDRSIEILKRYPVNERDDILKYFRCMFTKEPVPRQMLSWDESREMLMSGLVRFGSHTVNHEILDQISLQKAEEEILQSRKEIENNLGVTPECFAYPNGNLTPELKGILVRNGYIGAVITRKGFVGNDCDLFEIPRIGIHEDVSCTIPFFRSRIIFKRF